MPLRGSRAARAGVLAALALTLLASGGCPPVDGDPLDVEADGAKADAADTADAGDALDFDYLPPQDTAPAKDRCRVVYQIATRWEGDSGYQTFATVDYQGGPLQAWVVKLTYPVVTAVSGAWTSNGIFVGEPENHGTEVVVAASTMAALIPAAGVRPEVSPSTRRARIDCDASGSIERIRSSSSARIDSGRSSGRRARHHATTSESVSGTSPTLSLTRGASWAPFFMSTSIALRPR